MNIRTVRPPRITPAVGGRIYDWAREAQQCFRDISAALASLHMPKVRGAVTPAPAAIEVIHPFKVFTRKKEGGGYEAGVYYHSSLYKSLRPNDTQAITGLLSEDRTSGWFDLIGNDAIWLGVTFDGAGEVDWAGIDSWGQSDSFDLTQPAWSGENGYCEDDGEDPPTHQASRKLIAYSVAGEEGEPVINQVMFRDQILRDCNIDGRPARYPFDHEGGYPL